MAYAVSNSHVTDDMTWPRKVKLVTPINLEPNISKNSWRCYLATIVNYYIIFGETVRSAILATAWLLVYCITRHVMAVMDRQPWFFLMHILPSLIRSHYFISLAILVSVSSVLTLILKLPVPSLPLLSTPNFKTFPATTFRSLK